MNGNKINGFTNLSTGGTAGIAGIVPYYGTWTCANNMICITNGETSSDNKGNLKGPGNNEGLSMKSPVFKENNVKNTSGDALNTSNSLSPNSLNSNSKNNAPTLKVNQNNPNSPSINKQNVTPNITPGNHNSPSVGINGQNINRGNIPISAVTSTGSTYDPPVSNVSKPKQTPQPDYTSAMTIYGVSDDAAPGIWTYEYNTIYVGGSQSSGTNYSYCFYTSTASEVIKDNLFVNARTNSGTSTGSHACIYVSSAVANNYNYNAYIAATPATMFSYAGTFERLPAWITSTSCDKQAWADSTSDIVPTSLFTSVSTGNLHIVSTYSGAWISFGKGLPIAAIATDIDGNSRSASITTGVTDIGCSQFTLNPATNPPVVAVQDVTPGSGVTSNYTLWGRKLATLLWNAGGTTYPTSVNVKYYSGFNPSNVVGGNYSNSHTTYSAVGSYTNNVTFNLTYYFGDNETYTITTPSTNTILAEYVGPLWFVFPSGGNTARTSQLTYSAATQVYTVVTDSLGGFNDFALTDLTSALPVVIASFGGSSSVRDVTLNWTTSREMNNSGFTIERRILTSLTTSSYSAWQQLASLPGHGNTNEPVNYTYTDKKLNVGTYQYRLKQTDYNGNSEYFTLNNPENVVIGKPGNADVSQNYPNPSNPKSKIDYQIPFDGKVSIKVYDVVGKEVVTLVDADLTAGYYTAEFDGTNLASGIYIYRILAETPGQKFAATKKMVLLK